jgi:RNA polymerase sigma-70 factor (ECF subfamily)
MTTDERTSIRSEASGDERALVDALRRGDDDAYETLVRDQLPVLLAVTRRILRSEDEAQDAVQEAFLSAFKSIGGFDGKAKLSTWLHRIAINAALMRLRRRPRSRERSIEDLLPSFLDDGHMADPPDEWDVRPETAAQSKETADLVRRLIDELPENYRTVLMLRDIEGLDTAETAELLDVTANVVKVRLHRARQALRTLLDPHFRGGSV